MSKWVRALKNQTLLKLLKSNKQGFQYRKVCSIHFDNKDYTGPERRFLLNNAIPKLRRLVSPENKNKISYNSPRNAKEMIHDNVMGRKTRVCFLCNGNDSKNTSKRGNK